MLFRILGAAIAAWTLGVTSPATAQLFPAGQTFATAVTFTMPVNLTQLSPDLERVRLICFIQPSDVLKYPDMMAALFSNSASMTSDQFPWKDETWVVGGQVVTTMSVVIPIATEWLLNPSGKTATYNCGLLGFSKSLKQWGPFGDYYPAGAPFLLKGMPNQISGTFEW